MWTSKILEKGKLCYFVGVWCVEIKKSKFIKKAKTSGLVSQLVIRHPLKKIPL